MTAWRILRQQGYLTSYNQNAKYYTLSRMAQFDEQGLFGHSRILFVNGRLADAVLSNASQAQVTVSFYQGFEARTG